MFSIHYHHTPTSNWRVRRWGQTNDHTMMSEEPHSKIIIHHQYSLYHGCYPLHKSYSQVKGIWSTWNHVINYVDMQTPRLNCCQNDKPLQPTKMIFVIRNTCLLICNIFVSFPNDMETQQSRREVPWWPNQRHPGTLTLSPHSSSTWAATSFTMLPAPTCWPLWTWTTSSLTAI